MTVNKLITGVLIVIAAALPSCSSLVQCDKITERQAIFLMDVSDKKLFGSIESDLNANFPSLMQRTGLGKISPCQSFTLSFANLSSKDALEISSATISINRKGQSKKEEQHQANPGPLVQLMQQKINDYRLLTEDPQMTTNSNIANVLVKAINQANPDGETYIFLFSDLVENNAQLNLYKGVPDKENIQQVVEKMIEPAVLGKFRQLQKEGLQPKIIAVMKPESSGKVNQRNIKNFWISVFKELKIDDVQFIDNLSNNVEI